MCVKRDSFRHKGISVPLGSLLGFAVITVPSMRKGGKRLWFDCRKMWTLIKLPYANTGVSASFPAHSKRMPGEGVGGERLCLGFWCEIGFWFFFFPSQWKRCWGFSIPVKICPRIQIASEIRLDCSLRNFYRAEPALFLLFSSLSPSTPPPPPHPTGVCIQRVPRSEPCAGKLRELGQSAVILASFLQRFGALLLLANHEGALK